MTDDRTPVQERRLPSAGGRRWLEWAAPAAVGVALLLAWEAAVRWRDIPPYILPAPSAVLQTLVDERSALLAAWLVTIKTMAWALAGAVIGGAALAGLFASSRLVENSLFPFAVILQVTPLVAVTPFIVLWVDPDRIWLAQAISAWIVAFFPILSNTAIGLRQADPNLRDLFHLYRATGWQRLRWLLAPSALPYFLAGLRISANLALVGAIVAEFAIGAAPDPDNAGIATMILSSQLSQDTPTMFAALAVVSATGIALFLAPSLLSRWLLGRWHDSYVVDRR
jgi:NitT/TauT family transport system permease protein